MNEEEKKIIEKFVEKCNKFDESVEIKGVSVGEEYRILETVCKALDLVEKLQKENEELKEYIAIAPNLDEMTATKYRNIQQDAYIQGRAEEQQKAEQIIYENYIPIQKVKDKIEEIKQEKKKKYGNCLIKMYEDELVNRDIKILQELLEGRK